MISHPTVSPPPGSPASDVVEDRPPTKFDRTERRASQTIDAPADVPPPPRKRSGWGWLLILIVAAAAWFYRLEWLPWLAPLIGNGPPPPKSAPRTTPVVTAAARLKDMSLYLNGLGTVTAFKTVTVRSRVEGELMNVAFTEGQMVREGDLLAEVDPRPFEVQLAQAEGQLARDEAILKSAKLTLTRYQQLLPSKAVTQQQVDDQTAVVQQTEGTIRTDQAMVDNAQLQLTYCRIIAPISGRIGLRLVDQGNIVRANDLTGVAVITQLQPIALMFTIPQDDISRVQRQIQTGQSLTVDAYDRDFQAKLAAGELLAIDNQVDPTTGTLRMKAVFANEDNVLFPNQFVNARLLVDTKRGAVVVPAAAVQRGPSSTFVYVVKSDETVELRNVDLGPTEGAETSIESGLAPGELVVTEGIDKLQPGAKVATRDKKPNETDSKNEAPSKKDVASEVDKKGSR